MVEAGRLIYRRRTGRGVWLLVPMPLIAVWAAAAESGDLSTGMVPSIVAVIGIIATLWIAIGWSGRRRLAEIRLEDDVLVARRGHMLDRGEIMRIPLSETRNWKALLERYGEKGIEIAAFDHRGITYILQIEGAQYSDLETLNAWIAQDKGGAPDKG